MKIVELVSYEGGKQNYLIFSEVNAPFTYVEANKLFSLKKITFYTH